MKIYIDKVHILRLNNGGSLTSDYIPFLAVLYPQGEHGYEFRLHNLFPPSKISFKSNEMEDRVKEMIRKFLLDGNDVYHFPEGMTDEGSLENALEDAKKWNRDTKYRVGKPDVLARYLVSAAEMQIEDIEEYTRAGHTFFARIDGEKPEQKRIYTADDMDYVIEEYNNGWDVTFNFTLKTSYMKPTDAMFRRREKRVFYQDHYYVVQFPDKGRTRDPAFVVDSRWEVIFSMHPSRALKFPTEENAISYALNISNRYMEGFEVVKMNEPAELYLKRQDEMEVFWMNEAP